MSAPAAAIIGQAGPRPVINVPRILPRSFAQRKRSFEEKAITDKRKSKRYEGKRRNQCEQIRWEVGRRFMK